MKSVLGETRKLGEGEFLSLDEEKSSAAATDKGKERFTTDIRVKRNNKK